MLPIEEAEDRRRVEQDKLNLAMGAELRNRNGQFATPSPLADQIVAYCWDLWKDRGRRVRFLEPCAGTGSFFSSLRRIFPPDLIESAFACELDAGHADVARGLWEGAGLEVARADFLGQSPRGMKFNLLITNPPYVRHHHLSPARKEELRNLVRARLRIRVSGLAGLYCYFLLLSDAWLEEFGLSVWLIPSEFMDVNIWGGAQRVFDESCASFANPSLLSDRHAVRRRVGFFRRRDFREIAAGRPTGPFLIRRFAAITLQESRAAPE